jgi:hypothetical protein
MNHDDNDRLCAQITELSVAYRTMLEAHRGLSEYSISHIPQAIERLAQKIEPKSNEPA